MKDREMERTMEAQEAAHQLEPALPILAEEGASGFPEEPGSIGPSCGRARPRGGDILIKTDMCIQGLAKTKPGDAGCFLAEVHYRRFRGASGQGAGKEGEKVANEADAREEPAERGK